MPNQWLLLIDTDRESTKTIEHVGEELGFGIVIARKTVPDKTNTLRNDLETVVFQVDRPSPLDKGKPKEFKNTQSFEGLVFVRVYLPLNSDVLAHLKEGGNVWMRQVIDGTVTKNHVLDLLN